MKIPAYLYVFIPLICLVVFLYGLGNALLPLIGAFFLAYLLFPVVMKLERVKISRGLATLSVFGLVIGVVVLICILTLPSLYRDARLFLTELPQNFDSSMSKLQMLTAQYGIDINFDRETAIQYVKEYSSRFSMETIKSVTQFMNQAFSGMSGVLIGILNLFLFPVFFYYIIHDYEKISQLAGSLVPKKLRKPLKEFFAKSNRIFSGYIRGQLMVALILGLLYAFGLSVVGLRFGLLIGLVTGLLSIVPYAGFAIGFVTSMIVAFAHFSGYGTVIGVAAVFAVVQALEGLVITPKIVGDKVGLNPLLTMVALIVGGNIAGLAGMLVAIPVAGVLKIVLLDLKNGYLKSALYLK